jgi:hypothetical protein
VSDSAEDRAPVRRGGDWRRSGGDPRNSASSPRVNSPRSCRRLVGGDSASGSRVGTPGGGSPLVSGAGRCAGLGTGRRMMLGSITRSFRPPTSTRCSVSSRRMRTIFRFPSSWTDSITPTRRDALRPRSHLNMCFFPLRDAGQRFHLLPRLPHDSPTSNNPQCFSPSVKNLHRIISMPMTWQPKSPFGAACRLG